MSDDLSIGVGIDYDGSGWKAAEADIGKFSTGVASVASSTAGAAQGLGALDQQAVALAGSASEGGSALMGLGSAADELGAGLDGAAQSASATGSALDGIADAGSSAGVGFAAAGDGASAASASIADAGAKTDEAAQKGGALGGVFELLGDKARKNAEDQKFLGLSVGDLTEKLGGADGALGQYASKLTAINPATLAWIGGIGLAVAAVVGLGVALLSLGNTFDGYYDKIQRGTGASGAALQGLKDDFDAVYSTSAVGGDLVADTLTTLNQRLDVTGKTAQVLTGQFAALDEMGQGASVDQFASALNNWGMSAEQGSGSLETLRKIAVETGATIDDLTSGVAQGGPQFRAFGFSFEESAALVGQFNKAGLDSGQVIGGLTIAGKKYTAQGLDLRDGLNQTIESIRNATTEQERNAIALDAFGRSGLRMGDAIATGKLDIDALMATVAASPDTIASAAEATRDYGESLTILGHEAQTTFEPLGAVALEAMNAVVGGAVKAGSALLDYLEPGIVAVASGLRAVGPFLSSVGSGLGTLVGVVASAVGGVFELIDVLAQSIGGWGNVATIVGIAGAAIALAAGPITLVVGAVGALTFGIGSLNKATGEAQEEFGPAATSIASYGVAVDDAAAKSGFFAGVVSGVKGALGGAEGSIIRNADAWLKYNAGASDAVLSSDEMKKAHQALNHKLVEGRITQEEYQAALLNVADAVSFAAGEGHLLTSSQQSVADGMTGSLQKIASWQGGISIAAQDSEGFRAKLAELSGEFALGRISADEAKAGILAYAEGIGTANAALEDGSPAAAASASMATFAQEFGSNTALILHAGDGLLLGEQERADKFKQIGDDLNSGIATSLQSLWDTRKSYEDKFAEAREQDAQAQASARQAVQTGEAEHNQKMADLQAKAAAGGDAGAKANAAIAEEQKKWNGILSVATGGTQAATAKVQEQYNAEREAIRESLAQTVIDHLNAMVMMGDVSAETARGIYGALSEAYPGVEAINPVTEATLEFSAAVGDAMQGGDPSAIVTAIDTVEQKMVEADNVNRESLGIAQQTWQGIGDQAATGGAAVVAAAGSAADETTTRSAQQTAAHQATAASHAQLAEDVEAAGQKQVKATSTAATGMADKLGGVRGELSATAASARGVGTEVDRSFSGLGERAAGGLQGVSQALDDVRGAMAETAQEANNMSAGQVEALLGSQDAGHEAASGIDDAMSEVGDSMDQAAERTGELQTAVEELPTEVAVEVTTPGADEAIRTIERLLALVQKLKSSEATIATRHVALDDATSKGGSFAMEHWLDDLFDTANNGAVVVQSNVSDSSNGLLTETNGSGGLAWKDALDALAAGDYPVVITAELNLDEYNRIKAQFDSDIADTSGQLDEAARLASYWGQQLAGSWQGVSTLLREINENDLPAFIAGLALPEGIDTLDELIQHFESLSPDEQMDLWKRMFDDLKTLEGDFHKAWMDDAKKRDEEDARLIESRIRRIEELRQIEEEKAKKPGGGGGPAKEIALDPEIDAATAAVADLLSALGFVGSTALEDFYEAFTLGARDGIHSSEELAEALKFLQEETKRHSAEQAALEADRHDAAVLRLEELGDLTARQFDEWKDAHAEELRLNKELADLVAKRTAELEKARVAAEKALASELKQQAKDRADDEKTAHKLVLDHISERKDAEKDASTARLSALDDLKDAEGKRHNTALDDIKERGERERDTLKSLENQLSDMKLRSQAAQLAQGGLDEAKRVLAELQKTISRLPKSDKRERPGDSTSFTAASIGLSQDAIRAALATDKLTAAARRRLILLQRGASLGIAQLRQTLDEAEAAVELSADAKTDEVDLLKRQIDQQEYLVAVEKRRLEGVDERLKLELDGENERHDLEMGNIADRREAEQAAWDAYQRRFDDAKRAEDERSAAKLRSIENELRASLLAQGLEAGEDPEVAFQRAKAIADRFTAILDRLIGSSDPAAGGGLRVVGSGGLGAPGGINGLRGIGGLLPAIGKIVKAGDVFAVAAELIATASASFEDAVDESQKAARKSIRGDDDESFWAGNKYGATGHSYAARQRYLRQQAIDAENAKPEWTPPPAHLTRPNMGTAYDPNAGTGGEAGGVKIVGPGGPLGGLLDIDWTQTLGQPFAVALDAMSVTASQQGAVIADGLMGPTNSAILQAVGYAEMLRDTLSGIPALAGAGGGPVSIDRRTIFNGPVFIDRDLAEEIGLLDAARFIP